MPLSYGGGIKNIEQIRKIIQLGVEKIVLNTAAIDNINLIRDAVKEFGSSTICCCIDYKENFFGIPKVYSHSGSRKTNLDPIEWGKQIEQAGAGEIILQNISFDGTLQGYDFSYFNKFKNEISVPLIIAGGAKGIEDFNQAIEKYQIKNMAGGACFVYHGIHRAVLISYPNLNQLN